MEYRFTDGSPFPFQLNFIDLLRASVACAVELCTIGERSAARTERAGQARRELENDAETMRTLAAAVRKIVDTQGSGTARVGARIVSAAASIVDAETSERQTELDNRLRALASEAEEEQGRVLAALEGLLRAHDLPGTDHGLSLELPNGSASYWGRVLLTTPLGLNVTLAMTVPSGHRFAQPVRVRDVAPTTDIQLELPSGPLHRAPHRGSICLDRYFVTGLTLDTAGGVLRLRQKPVSASVGFDLHIGRGDELTIHAVHIRADGSEGPEGAQRLSECDTGRIEALVVALRQSCLDVARGHGQLELAVLDGAPLDDTTSAFEVVRRLVALLAPHASEIAARGCAAGELALKRELGDGRREEVYLQKSELLEQLAPLNERSRALFAPLGLLQAPQNARPAMIIVPTLPPTLIDKSRAPDYDNLVAPQNGPLAAMLGGPRWRQ
jgi:hypothetical protein